MFQGVGFPAFRILLVSAFVAASAPLAVAAGPASQPPENAAAAKALVAQNYGKIPLSFEANQGQADKTVKFVSRGSGYSLFLTDSSAVLALTKPDASNGKPGHTAGKSLKPASARPASKTDVVRMDLAGANRATHVAGMDQLPGTANYFIGNDPAQWHSGVPTFAKVRYAGVYPGVDLVYYGNQRQLEYDFVVAPGASPKPIRLQFVGAKKLALTSDGDLTVSAANGQIAFHKPVVYQVTDGVRQPVDGQFALLKKNTVGFTLGRYDHSKPLVIDPVLSYSTYLGGSGEDIAQGIAADSSGNAYVVGYTTSSNFPVTSGAFQTVDKSTYSAAPFNAFVTKLNATGTALVYSTYLGGSVDDSASAIAVDGSGNAYVVGYTTSTDFPTTVGAFQTVDNSNVSYSPENGFVTKLNTTGTALVYSTYLGGSVDDSPSAIAVDGSGDAYVIGNALSSNFPTTAGAFQVMNNASITSGLGNAFVTKFNPTGTALVYSTYLGGTGYGAEGTGIAVDSSGDAYVTGNAYSGDFPITSGAFQTVNKAPWAAGATIPGYYTIAANAFVTKLNPTGTALVYSTFLGGSTDDHADGIAVDSSGDAYVTGNSSSSNFPVTKGVFQPTNNADANDASNAFVTELNPAGAGLVYSTYLGGAGYLVQLAQGGESGNGDGGAAIAVDDLGDAYVAGDASSSNFPVTPGAFQTVNNAAGTGGVNAFIAKLNPGGSALLYSTYLGGSKGLETTVGVGIALDGVGGVYAAGYASATDFPTTAGAYQGANLGLYNSYIAKFTIGEVAQQVDVPNVVGDTQAAAETAITGAELVVGTVTTESSSTVASGDVISESPSAGTSVSSGSAVNLVVSTGSAQVSVPNVVGDTQAAATTAITGAGLVVGTVTAASSSTVASGNVISESPGAGNSVNSGSAVNLVVSAGSGGAGVDTVPNVVGDTQAAATTAIIAAGLPLGTVSTASSSTVASGDVISESPSAGTSVNSGSPVNLVVSTGPAAGPATTTTSIAQSGSPGNYTLTATVVGSGTLAAAPTGTVSFLDTSNGDAMVATATLGGGTSGALAWTNTQTPATEPAPQSIVVGDFNGDGIPDIAAGSNGYVSVLIGKGDGTFKAANNLAALSNNQLMAAGAFVGSIRPTAILTVSNSASSTNNAQLILGNGSGGETVEVPFSLPCGSASAVATADFNGDGNQDFVVVCQVAGNSVFAVFLGNGNGTFQAPTIIPGDSTILAIGVGNFLGNGRADIAVLAALAGTSDQHVVTTYENDGHGNFTVGVSIAEAGLNPVSMVAADFNGDGKSDLAIANSGDNTVTILLGAGNGGFFNGAIPATGETPSGIVVGDFNGDGIPDLAVSNSGDNTVTILLGKGDGTFTTAATPPTGNTPSALAVGDFITGGRLGLAVANSGAVDGSVTVLNQQSTQTATATATGISPAGSGAHLVEASYPGDSNYAASVSGTTSLNGQTVSTSLSLTPNPTSSTSGQQVLLTATLSPFSSGGNSTNGESVTFYSGSTSLGTGTLSSGVATLSTTALPTGTDSLTAKFGGDANFNASTSTAVNFVVSATPQAATPLFSPVAGSYASTQSVIITDSTTGAAIYYTTNGNPPTTSSTLYNGAITVSATETIEAIAVASGYTNSAVASATYTITVTPQAATPVISPAAGSYTSTQSVTITDSTTGAAIYYTTNGNPPTTSSTLYNGAITVSATETIEAIAVASGYTNSAVATANYVIVTAAPGYTLSANPSSLTIHSGSSASTVITLTPTGGFTGTVNFSCGTLPSLVTCTFVPASLTVTSSTALTTTLTIGTTGTAMASLGNRPAGTVLPTLLAALILLPLGFMRRVLRTRKAGSQWLGLLLLAGTCLAAAGLLGTAGCGGSSSSTRAGTYSVPITVTSGSTTVPLNLSITID
jgi:beta-lactam-binding protein with PASTA domain